MGKNINEYNRMDKNKEKEFAQRAMNSMYFILALGVLCYYMLPMLIGLYLDGNGDVFYYVFMYINTVYCFGSCYIHASKFGFRWYMALAVGLFFVPSCIAFGYTSVMLLGLVYVALGFFGELGGYATFRRKVKNASRFYRNK